MTGGNAPLGRRDNGLHTTDYAAVADVDPRVGEHLLDVLGERGIAAYLKPTADEDPVTRATALPSPPTDRLYVDRASITTARQLLNEAISGASEPADMIAPDDGLSSTMTAPALAPTSRPEARSAPGADAFEAAWAQIVAGYDATAAPERNWALGDGTSAPTPPASTSDPTEAPADPTSEPVAEPTARRVVKPAKPYLNDDGGSLLDGLDSFGADLPDDDDEDFKPPAPPPLPRFTATAIIGVLAILVGLLAVFFPDVLAILPTTEAQVLGGALVLGGTALLISRLRSGHDDDDYDPDDGAVV